MQSTQKYCLPIKPICSCCLGVLAYTYTEFQVRYKQHKKFFFRFFVNKALKIHCINRFGLIDIPPTHTHTLKLISETFDLFFFKPSSILKLFMRMHGMKS